MQINVTQEHLSAGRKYSGIFCPVSLACKDAGLTGIWLNAYHCGDKFPQEVQVFIERFDKGRQVEPFSFELTVE